MKKIRKLLALLLVCLIIASLAACEKETTNTEAPSSNPSATSSVAPDSSNPSPSNPSPPAGNNTVTSSKDKTLNIAATQDSGTLYPLGVTGGFVSVMYCFYEPLFDTMADGSRRWILATGLDRISDIQYTLTIREGVKFSNGNPLTAEDVMFSMELCAANFQFALNVKVVDFTKTKVTGEYTIDLWYTNYNASQEPGFASMLILDKESYDEVALATKPIGTGPYTVTEYVTNNHLSLTARDDYWGGEIPIKNLQFKVINEEAQIVNALERHEIDMATVPISQADYVEKLGYTVAINSGGYNYVTLFSMLPGNPLESKEARWAVSHAIDRESIAEILYKGRSSVNDYPSSHGMSDFEARFANLNETYSVGYNPERARQLAEQSGLVGKKLRIITNGSADFNTMALIIQGDLEAIGVDSEILNYDQATYFPTMADASNFEIALFNPSTPSMLAVDVMAMYLTFIPLGWEGSDRDHYGELSMGAISTYDPRARGDLLYEAIKMFVDFDPWFGLCEVVISRAQSPYLQGVQYTPAGSIYYQDIYYG